MRRKFGSRLAAAALAGLALLMVGNSGAAMAQDSGGFAPRAFDVTFDGYYLVTKSAVSSRLDMKGLGIINSDPAGNLNGIEDFTLVNPALPSGSSSVTACGGSAGGSITSNADGTYAVTVSYTPSGSAPAGCFASTTNLVCTRHVVRTRLESDLAAGRYVCVATNASTAAANTSIDAVSETMRFGAHIVDNANGD